MKKFFILTILVLLTVGFVFGTEWGTLNLVDDFGDPTDVKRLYTWIYDVKYGDYSWECEDCAILIDRGESYCPYVPQFYVGPSTFYDEWTIRIKLDDGTINEYNGELYGGKYIFPHGIVEAKSILSDLKKGCKIVIYPVSNYSTDKYNLGYIKLTDSDLSKI